MDFVVYENQRWWLGNGWGEKMLPNERNAWSDLSGNLTLPKSIKPPQKNWFWTSDWSILKSDKN